VQIGTAPFAPDGALLPTEDVLALFQLGARSIRVGAETYPVTGDFLREIRSTMDVLRVNLDIQNEIPPALNYIRELTSSQKITQESVDRLTAQIAAMPSEKRSAFMGLLANITAVPWISMQH
jgi:hypothetical protein